MTTRKKYPKKRYSKKTFKKTFKKRKGKGKETSFEKANPYKHNVKLIITPVLIYNENKNVKLNNDSIKTFKKWLERHIEDIRFQTKSKQTVSNINISIESDDKLKIEFTINDLTKDKAEYEGEMASDAILSLDDDGNYPIYVDTKEKIYLNKPKNPKTYECLLKIKDAINS